MREEEKPLPRPLSPERRGEEDANHVEETLPSHVPARRGETSPPAPLPRALIIHHKSARSLTSSSAFDVGPQSPPELGDLGGRRLRPMQPDVHTSHVDDVEKHEAVVACVSPLNPPILGDLGALTRVLTTTFAKGNDVTRHQPRAERGGRRKPRRGHVPARRGETSPPAPLPRAERGGRHQPRRGSQGAVNTGAPALSVNTTWAALRSTASMAVRFLS
jgi:hypothetical protein